MSIAQANSRCGEERRKRRKRQPAHQNSAGGEPSHHYYVESDATIRIGAGRERQNRPRARNT